jgi:hypothetical protein
MIEEIEKQDSESYKHSYAKMTVCRWLRIKENYFEGFVGQEFKENGAPYDVIAITNRMGKKTGVFEEYPLTMEFGSKSWDDISYFGFNVPKYIDIIRKGMTPVAILDIGIIHGGHIAYGVEIVHKHDVTEDKIKRIQAFREKHKVPTKIFVVDAEWVLCQTSEPWSIEVMYSI